ncbi:MAG: phenylpyruvate tautomerase MIF-related protein [Gammaproteobacteria bacterium]|nr:phenylpyruvate tautomerase MIF-related protein [Gammaproteobacteria bacterium]
MPYLSIQTNQSPDEKLKNSFLIKISKLLARELGKPESYVMTAFSPTQPMTFAGNSDPCAYLELKSIGLPANKTANLSAELCDLVNKELGISTGRVYIEFSDAPRAMWGWNKTTF